MREIMSALEAMGIVVSRHGNGTFITSLNAEVLAGPLTFVLDVNRDALWDLFEVRVLLEAGAAQTAAERIDDSALERLELLLNDMRAARDADSLLTPDLLFHRLIHEASGNRLLLALMDSLRVLTRQSLLASAASEAARHAAVEEHQSILEALRRHDGPAAALAMRRHVENARQRAESADRLRQR
jgi:GntR family transcriptional repressor for pyruvate dehydrogenase complex